MSCPFGRLFTCGATDNGEYLFRVAGPTDAPGHWHAVVDGARDSGWFTYDGPLSHRLTGRPRARPAGRGQSRVVVSRTHGSANRSSSTRAK